MEGNKWIGRPKFGLPAPSPDATRLLCFTPAGCGPTTYTQHGWASLPASIEVAPVLLPGRAQRLGEAPLRTVAEMAAGAAQALAPLLGERPYAVFGHSASRYPTHPTPPPISGRVWQAWARRWRWSSSG